MAWPTPQDYSEAIQSPAHCFKDPELRAGTVETDRLGLPRPIAGGFAVVYRIRSANKSFAVRCFLSEVKDLQERYLCIEAALRAASLPYFVRFAFLDSGIRIQGRWYPTLKMEWTEGETLIEYVRRSLANPEALQTLANDWQAMCAALSNANIAHGDLQHGNVLISGGRILLVDYDGMFVPSLQGKPASELGHRHYQHPQRRGQHFDSWLDGFSASSIMAALLAFSVDRRLWDQAKAGDESLLFRQEDYEAPAKSSTLALLKNHQDQRLRQLGQAFEVLIRTPLHQIGLPSSERLGFSLVKALPGDGSWLGEFLPQRPVQQSQKPAATAGPTPPALPSLPEWLAHQPAPSAVRYFGVGHGAKGAITFLWLGSLIPAILDGIAGMIASAILVPLTYIGWRLWVRSRFERHPLTLERRIAESSLPSHSGLLAQAKELRAKWAKCAEQLQVHQVELQTVPRRLEEKRQALGTSQGTEMAAARERFKQARAVAEKQGEDLVRKESAEIDSAKRPHEERISQLNQKLSALESQRDAERDALWSKCKTIRNQLSLIPGKHATRRSSEVATHDREERNHASQLSSLMASRQGELDSTLASLQQRHVFVYLSGKRVVGATMEGGIGPGIQQRLADHGVRTAADVEASNLMSIPGIGPARQAAILKWRKKLEGDARRSMPGFLPSQVESSVRQKYAVREAELNRLLATCRSNRQSIVSRLAAEEQRERDALQLVLTQEENRVRPEEQNIYPKYADKERVLRLTIQMEERNRDIAVAAVKCGIQQQREALTGSRGASEVRLNTEVAAITQRFAKEFQNADADRQIDEERIRSAIRARTKELDDLAIEIRSIEAQAAEVARQLSCFDGITFKAYLSEALSFRKMP